MKGDRAKRDGRMGGEGEGRRGAEAEERGTRGGGGGEGDKREGEREAWGGGGKVSSEFLPAFWLLVHTAFKPCLTGVGGIVYKYCW